MAPNDQNQTSNDLTVGLDVSTSVVGIAVLDASGVLVELAAVDLRKLSGLWEKTDAVERGLVMLKTRLRARGDDSVMRVFVEQNLGGFRLGFTSAATIQGLSRFNGMTCLLARQVFGIDPVHVDFREARRALGIQVAPEKKCGVDVKQQIWQQVSTRVTWPWPTKTLKSGPRKGQTEPDETRYDMADAWVVARAGQQGITVTKKAKKKRPKK